MSEITILISTSPRPSHPRTRILDQTILSISAQLPEAPIVIMADGPVKTDAYLQFLHSIHDRYANGVVQTHQLQAQQSGMLAPALQLVTTPFILYLEDDWEIHPNVEWSSLTEIIRSQFANYIRLYHGHRIHPLHEHMMCGRVIEQGIPLVKTTQFSMNPHLASTSFYRGTILPRCVGQTDMIENIMHGPCASAEWEEYRLCIYNPIDCATMKRLTHLDGK